MDEPKLPAFFIPGFSLQKGSSFPEFPGRQPKKNDGFPLRNAFSLPLRARLLAWCEYAHWYGPDEYEQSIGPYLDIDGVLHTARPLYEVQTGFAFPPATEKQIAQAEEAMGFVHLYRQATSLEDWFERWLAGELHCLYPSSNK